VSIYQIQGGSGLFYAQPNYNNPAGTVWMPKQLG
jgi:hypothetical protein